MRTRATAWKCALLVLIGIALSGVGLVAPAYAAQATPNASAAKYDAAAEYSSKFRGVAVIVLKGSQIVYERYDNGWDATRAINIASGTKSFNCTLAVAAQVDGLLTLDEKAADTLTEWKTDPRKAQITIRQLLSYTSGLKGDEAEFRAAVTSNVYISAVGSPAAFAPGTVYRYDPTQTSAFNELLHRKLSAAGLKEDTLAYLTRRVFAPIGLTYTNWRRDIDGNPLMAGGASLTALEWLKFGQLMLDSGKWNGKQILPADKLAECVKPSTTFAGYGLNFWLNAPVPKGQITADFEIPMDGTEIHPGGPKDLYMAAGAGKERLYIIPSKHMVIVRLAQNGDRRWSDAEFLKLLGV